MTAARLRLVKPVSLSDRCALEDVENWCELARAYARNGLFFSAGEEMHRARVSAGQVHDDALKARAHREVTQLRFEVLDLETAARLEACRVR